MKKIVGSVVAMAGAAVALGQANFTIVRPADGAHVREKVHILFPKGSIPQSGYVGIFLNGQLIDALVPPTNGKFAEYVLDTKGRGLPDTKPDKPDRLEAKLYVDYENQPRITKVSSVDLYIGNQANISVPNSGIKLRYAFKPFTEMVYDIEARVTEDTISESENAKGGKAAELPLDSEKYRILYAVDNSYADGDGLVRMQALPEKGKDYAVLTVPPSTEQEVYTKADMASIYMRLSSTGHEIFGSIPLYYQMFGSTIAPDPLQLYADFPLPTLPEKAVRPGDSWASRFQEASIDPAKQFEQDHLVRHFPARGEFVGVEWERGHPCAKIRNVIAVAEMSDDDKKLLEKGAGFGGDKVQVDETIWFAMDTHKVLKVIRDMTLETKTQAMGGAGGAPGAAGGYPGTGGYPSGKPRLTPSGGGGGGGAGDWTNNLNQRGRPGMPGRPGGGAGQYGPPGGYPGGMGGSGRSGGPGATEGQYIRLRIQMIFTLE